MLQRPVEPSQYVSLAYSDALITAGVTASVGSVGDSYDNALAETVNGLFKAELIHSQRIWESTQAVEIATMGWVHWWNTERLHEALGYRTPAEVEASYTQPHDDRARARLTTERNPGRFNNACIRWNRSWYFPSTLSATSSSNHGINIPARSSPRRRICAGSE